MRSLQGIQRWPIDWHAPSELMANRPGALLLPEIASIAGLPYEVAALLPNHAFNDQLLAGLVDRPAWAKQHEIACCFMADPFLNAQVFAGRLQRKGLRRLCNLPTVSHLGAELATRSNEVGLGWQRETERLAEFAELGLGIYPVIVDGDALDRLDGLRPDAVIVARSFERDQQASDLAATAAAAKARFDGRCPVLVLAGGRRMPGQQTRREAKAFDGVIRYG